jgi:hypothetical protein
MPLTESKVMNGRNQQASCISQPTLGSALPEKGLVTGTQVQVNGATRNTVLVDGTHLTATLAASDVANKGDLNLTVVNPKPGGGTSNAMNIAVA